MAWIEVHQEVPDHPKTRKLARRLGVPPVTAFGHLVSLWLWAMQYAPDGDLGKHGAEDVAIGARWEGEADLFLDAMKGAGFTDDDLRLHDWEQYAGRLIEKRRVDAERKRDARARSKDVPVASDGRPSDGAGFPSDGAGTYLTSPTVPTEPTYERSGRDKDGKPHKIVTRLAKFCVHKNRAAVQAEALGVVDHCRRYVDESVIEEALTWAESNFKTRPELPRSVFSTIQTFAKRRNVAISDLPKKVLS